MKKNCVCVEEGQEVVVSAPVEGVQYLQTCIGVVSDGGVKLSPNSEPIKGCPCHPDETGYLNQYGWDSFLRSMNVMGRVVYSGLKSKDGKIGVVSF